MRQLRLAARMAGIGVSPILALSAQAGALRAEGREIIDLTVGEPDFETPWHVRDAAARAMAEGKTRYTPLAGTGDLRRAVADHLLRRHGLSFPSEAVIACAGAKQVIHNALAATLDPGDEVVLPTPYWSSYADMVRLEGGFPVVASGRWDPARGWRLDAETVEAAITPRTRWLILNAPGNPGGAALDPLETMALSAVLERHPHVWLLSDDIYEDIVFEGRRPTLAAVCPELAGRTLIVGGVSKAYAMTGWRLGWGAGPLALIAAMTAVQSQTTSAPCSISQAAAVAALQGSQAPVDAMVEAFRVRRDFVRGRLQGIVGITCPSPDGAFYLFPSITARLGSVTADGTLIGDDTALCAWLLQAAGVALVPGSAFGTPGHVRLSFAASIDSLATACDRLEAAFSNWTTKRDAA